jgi:hypothetical protein
MRSVNRVTGAIPAASISRVITRLATMTYVTEGRGLVSRNVISAMMRVSAFLMTEIFWGWECKALVLMAIGLSSQGAAPLGCRRVACNNRVPRAARRHRKLLAFGVRKVQRPKIAPWHYVDVPLDEARYDAKFSGDVASKGCVVDKIS